MQIKMSKFDHQNVTLLKRQSWKIQAWMGIQTLTSAMPVQTALATSWLSYHIIVWVNYKHVDVEIDDDNTLYLYLSQDVVAIIVDNIVKQTIIVHVI